MGGWVDGFVAPRRIDRTGSVRYGSAFCFAIPRKQFIAARLFIFWCSLVILIACVWTLYGTGVSVKIGSGERGRGGGGAGVARLPSTLLCMHVHERLEEKEEDGAVCGIHVLTSYRLFHW